MFAPSGRDVLDLTVAGKLHSTFRCVPSKRPIVRVEVRCYEGDRQLLRGNRLEVGGKGVGGETGFRVSEQQVSRKEGLDQLALGHMPSRCRVECLGGICDDPVQRHDQQDVGVAPFENRGIVPQNGRDLFSRQSA